MARPFAAPHTVFNARISGRRNIAYATLDLDDVKTVKNHFGVRVNDVVMALVSGVLSLNGNLDVGLISCPELLPDLWEMADDFAIGMEELLAAAR